jgi:twitching motility protein PilT
MTTAEGVRSIGDVLAARGVITAEQLAWAKDQKGSGSVAGVLLSAGIVTEVQVVAAAGEHLGVPFADLDASPPDPSLGSLLPAEAARRSRAVPIGGDATSLMVAIADPTDAQLLAWVARHAGTPVRASIATPAAIARALDLLYATPTGAPTGAVATVTGVPAPISEVGTSLDTMLGHVVAHGASDLHLSVGKPAAIRIDGQIWPLEGEPALTPERTRALVESALNEVQLRRFDEELELDTSYTAPAVGRFRMNAFVQRGSVGAVLRAIPLTVPEFSDLGLPSSVATFADAPRGLVLVTGPTGSGKSTTLASLVDIVNRTRRAHIMTVEDPIEFLHQHKQSTVNQREVGQDTLSFASALKHVLRQDPDVILVGEMRDLETIAIALTAAETGHLVFGTLHTQSAAQSIDRIVDVFPSHQQQQIRTQLAGTLRGVVTQQLVPLIGKGRTVAAEVLVVTNAVRTLIREGKTHQIASTMQSGAKQGMQTMDHCLAHLVRDGHITIDTAVEHCHDEDDMRRLAGAAGSASGRPGVAPGGNR